VRHWISPHTSVQGSRSTPGSVQTLVGNVLASEQSICAVRHASPGRCLDKVGESAEQ